MKRKWVVVAFVLVVSGFSRTGSAQQPTPAALVEQIQGLLEQLRGALAPAPRAYTALTDRLTRPKPAILPTLGPAGTSFIDPVFGGKTWRATDATTSAGSSLRVASNTSLASWNADGSRFFVMNAGGAAVFFAFDPVTGPKRMTAVIASQLEPSFSYVDPAVIYGVVAHQVRKWNIVTGASTAVLDLDTLGMSLGASTYAGGLVTSDHDDYVVFFGGGGQDQHFYVRHAPSGKLLDTRPLGFKVHSAILERAGPHVIVYPAADPKTGRLPEGIAQIQIWNTATDVVTPVTIAAGGHASVGYGDLINQDIVPGTPWDPQQWVRRQLNAPERVTNAIATLLPARTYPNGGVADHQSYRHARPGVAVPIVSAVYRYGGYAGPWRAWDDEVIGLDPNGPVYRFAHHYSIAVDFWDQPIVSVRPQADWAIVTTNYGQSLGGRQDVLVVQLR